MNQSIKTYTETNATTGNHIVVNDRESKLAKITED